MALSKKVLLALVPFYLQVVSAASGTGATTRYWDCCKASCAWSGKASVSAPVTTCDASDNPLTNVNAVSGCNGGAAYMCSNQSPWAVSSTLAYGFAATNIAGGSESTWCCACYQLTFTSAPLIGKTMIVQSTNTGGDLGSNQFDLAMPGGGFGIYNGCTAEWGTPANGWGAQYGGVSSRSMCDDFPAHLQPGCYFRWDWFQGADNPAVTFTQVACPAALTAKSGCVRSDDTPTGPSSVSTWTSGAAGTSSTSTATGGTTTSTTSAVVTTTSASSGTCSAKYGQCGGTGWTGPTCCTSSTCTYNNAYYSQCL